MVVVWVEGGKHFQGQMCTRTLVLWGLVKWSSSGGSGPRSDVVPIV